MKIEYVILADAAQAAGGKLFVLGGGWTVFRSANFPAPLQFALAASVAFSADESGEKYPLSVVVADDAGFPIVPEIKGEVETGSLSPDLPRGVQHRMPLVINVSLSIPRAGKYVIVVIAGSSRVETA
jgi:hypothetical protein